MAVDQDAASGWFLPSNSSQWTELLSGTGLSNPTSLWLCQESSGNLADSIGSNTLPAFGTPLYQQSVSGWTRKAIGTDDNSSDAFDSLDSGLPDPGTTSVLFLAFVAITSTPAGSRGIMRIGDSNSAHLRFTAGSRFQMVNGAGTTGTVDPSTTVHPLIIRLDQTANTVKFFSNDESVSDTFASPSTKRLSIGANDVNAASARYLYMAMWSGAAAEMDDAEVADLLDVLETGPLVITPDLASGTTIDAMKAGSVSVKYTVAIEGYDKLLTDATAQQAIDAWYAQTETQHYLSALPGLYVTGDYQQQLDWRNPFPRGGSLFLHVAPDAADTLGIAMHRAEADDETELGATLTRSTADVTVKATSGFASSGEASCGTECFEYDAVTGTTFETTMRGKYAALHRDPAATAVPGGAGWSETHRYGTGPLEVLIAPRVTSTPTMWIGKWVSVYLHKYDPSIPALNSKDDALRLFAGKIESITDDPATGCTVIELKHVLDHVGEATIGGRDPWSGKVQNLIELREDMTFEMSDVVVNGTAVSNEDAVDLVVVASGATGTSQVNAGQYTPTEIYQILNEWLVNDPNLQGDYNFGLFLPNDNTYRSDLYWTIPGTSSSDAIGFELHMPSLVAARLGYVGGGSAATVNGFLMTKIADTGAGGKYHSRLGEDPIMRMFSVPGVGGELVSTTDNVGTFVDQQSALPGSVLPLPNLLVATEGWGIFVVDETFLAYGYTGNGNDGLLINAFQVLPEQYGLNEGNFINTNWQLPWRQNGPEYVPIRQIFALEFSLSNALLNVFKSTGTPGYNDATWDALAYGLGLSIPYEICDADFDTSVNALPHSDKAITLLIDKPIKLSTLLAGELIIRRAFLRWNNETGKLEFATWKSPTESNSVAVLDEANKAAPVGNTDHHRSVTTKAGGWAVPNVTIRYNRSLQSSPDGGENFRDSITIVDRAAIDALGGDGPALNIDTRGTFGDFAQTGQTADSLAAGFMATMPYFSNPARLISRSIDQRLYYLSVGEVIRFDDEYARDPATGQRGVSRYGVIIRHRYNLGGLTPNAEKPADQGGDVDIFALDVNRVASYVPSARVDETQTNGGYNAGTKVLTCYAHAYSEATEAVDCSHFDATYKVRVIEIDPVDPTSPQSWDDTVAARSGNTLTLTTGLAGWDSSKLYRVVFDDYSDAVTLQQAKTFQADDADGKIQNLRVPYEYGVGGGNGNHTYWSGDDDVELIPNAASGDGVGRDVGHEVALARLLNNVNVYKTAVSSPCLNNSAFDPTAVSFGSSTWWLLQCGPVFLGGEQMTGQTYRLVSVAPHFASTAGAEAIVRVTLSRTPPIGSSLLDVHRGSIISETEFSTTSTTFATPTPETLDARVKGTDGVAWVYVEVNSACTCWGLSHLQVLSIQHAYTLINE